MLDRVARRLLAALAGTTPAFMSRTPSGEPYTVSRRLVAALAGSTPAFSPTPRFDPSNENSTTQGRRTADQQVADLALQPRRMKQPNFPQRLYYWRYEILAVTLLPYALVNLVLWLGPLWSAVAFCLVSAPFCLRSVRSRFRARIRAIRVQHRLRLAFAAARIYTKDGRRPMILWARPVYGDIVVSLFCPPGIGFEQIHASRNVLAAACAVPEVYVDRHPRYAALITLTLAPTPARTERPIATSRLGPPVGEAALASDLEAELRTLRAEVARLRDRLGL
jgi:hypothetical protein